LVFWTLGAGWLSKPLLHLAQRDFEAPSQPTFATRSVIVLMGGGTRRTSAGELVPKSDATVRIQVAAELYRACRKAGGACRVIVSGGDPQHNGQAEADNYAPYLLARGVASSDLTRENRSRNTYENAQNVAGIVHPERDQTVIVVTSAYHMRRSLQAFEAFGFEPQPFVSNIRVGRATFYPRFAGFMDAQTALHELIGEARFHVYRLVHLY
jgi:uncharacterized SAM-binding protein YcdF (DUF218 family)